VSFPAYEEYKESGIGWTPRIPIDWSTGALRWLAMVYAGGTPDKRKEEYWDNGTVPWLNSGAVNQQYITRASALITEEAFENSSAKWIPEQSLVIALAGQGKTKGMVAQLGIRATCNQSMAAIVPGKGLVPRFLFWWLTSNYQNIRNLSGGDLRDGLNLQLIGAVPCLLPALEEQKAIASFLDQETSKIDALVAEQRRLVELLKEKRQAVISQAVTKGLDPNVPMKPSGKMWIGDIPAHWSCTALTRIAERVVVGIAEAATHAYADSGIPILRSTNIRAGLIRGTILYVEPSFADERDSKRIFAGDLVTVRTGNAGVTAEIPRELDGCQCFTMLITTLNKAHNPSFFTYWMNSNSAQCYFLLEGWGTAQVNISVPILKALPVPIPAIEEQNLIVEYLDGELQTFNSLILEAERAITLLQERRTALISAAVTGKIDVSERVLF